MGLQFGIVGLGMIADFHARAIRAMSGGRGTLVACCSRHKEKADAFARKFDCAPYASLEDFLRHPGLQIVTVCTPSGTHRETALAAAAAGKHLLVEKPLEITARRCRAIVEACRSRGVLLAGIFPSRFHEAARAVKGAIDRGRLGRITLGSAYVKWYRSQEYYDRGGWHGTRQWDGGGALMNQSIHAIDLLQWFMGPVASVHAFTATLGHERIEVEDNAAAALRFVNGALGAIEGSTCVFPGFLKRIEVSGTRGSIILQEGSRSSTAGKRRKPCESSRRSTGAQRGRDRYLSGRVRAPDS